MLHVLLKRLRCSVIALIQKWFEMPHIFAFVLGFIASAITPLAMIAAITGAMMLWGWSFLFSLGVYVAMPVVVAITLGFIFKKRT